MSSKLLVIITLIVIVVVGLTLVGNKKTKAPEVTPTAPSATEKKMSEVIIFLTNSGFSPKTLTVKRGTKIVWTNTSGKIATVNSSTHPTHQDYLPLNLGEFKDGSSFQLVFDKEGTYRYHNHLNPDETGEVTVE